MEQSPPDEPEPERGGRPPVTDSDLDRSALITPAFATEHTLTPSDVAAIFNVKPKTVSRWATAGELPCITTPGGHRRFRYADVVALLNES
ncbi:MAG: helix-turn-helix domain-containing protein [Gordonia polyisoprenivorans]|nr:helix-turn-helix domain-containing protein [Gordonia polyisoprenivorans]